MRKIFLLLVSIILFAKTVTVTGSASTPEQAKKEALRAAVEAVCGADLKSSTYVKNGKLLLDKIISNTSGLIEGYKEVDRYKENGYWNVTLRVTVNKDALLNIKQKINSQRAMRTFQDANFKNRSVLVLYRKAGENALPKDYMAVEELLNTIEDELRDKSFDVILPDNLPGMAKKDEFSDTEMFEMGNKAKADAIVVATINAGKRKTDDGYSIIYARVSLKSYDPTSRRLFASVIKRGKVLANSTDFGIQDAAARAAGKVAKNATEILIEKIVKRLSTGAKQWIVVTFKGGDEDIQDEILDNLDELGYQYKVVYQKNGYLKVKISSNLSGSNFRRVIKKSLKKEGIKLKTLQTQGDMIEFKIKGEL